MSLEKAAKQLASKGRNGDTLLVHMHPQEVAGLQQLAKMHGTSMTVNPKTGLPEAFGLKNILNTAATMVAGFYGGPAGAAAAAAAMNKLEGGSDKSALLAGIGGGLGAGSFGAETAATQLGTDAATQGATEMATQAATDATTQGLAGAATDATTQGLAGAATDATTQGLAGAATDVATQGATNAATQGAADTAQQSVMNQGLGSTAQAANGTIPMPGGVGYGGMVPKTDPSLTSAAYGDTYGTASTSATPQAMGPSTPPYSESYAQSLKQPEVPLPGDAGYGVRGIDSLRTDPQLSGASFSDSALTSGDTGVQQAMGMPDAASAKGFDVSLPTSAELAFSKMGQKNAMGLLLQTQADEMPGPRAKQRLPGGIQDYTYSFDRDAEPGKRGKFTRGAYRDVSTYAANGGLMQLKKMADGGTTAPAAPAASTTGGYDPTLVYGEGPTGYDPTSVYGAGANTAKWAPTYTPPADSAMPSNRMYSYDPTTRTFTDNRPAQAAAAQAAAAQAAAAAAAAAPIAYQGITMMANGGLTALAAGGTAKSNLGGYSDGGQLLRGPGDGVSDSIPATIGGQQPAALADGEFVVPARIVSELGNGSTEAGSRKLYAMLDRIQNTRKKSVGKGKVAVNTRADKHLPA